MNKRLCLLGLALILTAGCAPLEQKETDRPETLTSPGMDIVQQGPLMSRRGSLRCSVTTGNSSGRTTFAFHTLKKGIATTEYTGEESTWIWSPKEPGIYQIKGTATDETGTIFDSGWSDEYHFAPPVTSSSLYAVLPVDNISATKAPLKEIQQAMTRALSEQGHRILAQEKLEKFMEINRMRYTGGLNASLGSKLKGQYGVDAVFITSLETWQDEIPPRISLVTRVVLTGRWPEILWIDSVGLTGNDAPGLLGLGRIKSAEQLLSKAVERLMDSYQLYLAGDFPSYRFASGRREMVMVGSPARSADFFGSQVKGRHLPRFTFRSPDFNPAGHYLVATVPFLSINARKHAGDVVALHFVKQLHRYENLRVVEPGLVRQTLLDYRIIMEAGPSLASSDILSSERVLDADLVLSGKVFDYQGVRGISKVDFSVQAFDGKKREVIWASRSYVNGDAGVYFFDVGRVSTAHGLTTRMSKAVVNMLEE